MSSVNPEDINAFAGMLGKLNSIQEGRKVVDTKAGKADRLAKNDMTAILSAFAEKSGTQSALSLTPEAITESVAKPDQIGAEFEPKDISPVLGEPEKDHPMDGMLVGEAEEVNEEEVDEMIRKLGDKYRLYSKDGKKNLGTFDSRKAAEKHEREVQYFKHAGESVEESVANEDSLSDIKKRLGDYLQDIKDAPKAQDKDLTDKKKLDADKLGPAIKTISTDDGKEIKIHGNEDDGFRLKINDKVHSAKFKSFDEAQMACEAYVAKRKTANENQDYVEEK